jgi:hypothetical protein
MITQSISDAENEIEVLTKEMKLLKINNMKLKGFQSLFINLYEESKQYFAEIKSGAQTLNKSLIYQAREKGKLMNEREHILIQEIKPYCSK